MELKVIIIINDTKLLAHERRHIFNDAVSVMKNATYVYKIFIYNFITKHLVSKFYTTYFSFLCVNQALKFGHPVRRKDIIPLIKDISDHSTTLSGFPFVVEIPFFCFHPLSFEITRNQRLGK
mgnify:CR=1 FL=1